MMKRAFVALGSTMSLLLVSAMAFAQEHAAAATDGSGRGLAIFGVMFGMSLATVGGALGQGKAAASALEGIARNPGAAGKVMTPMIIGLALIESLVLYSWVISFLLLGKI